jgi:hypothetical protein
LPAIQTNEGAYGPLNTAIQKEKAGAFCDFDQQRLTRQKEEVGRAELLWGHSALVDGFAGG